MLHRKPLFDIRYEVFTSWRTGRLFGLYLTMSGMSDLHSDDLYRLNEIRYMLNNKPLREKYEFYKNLGLTEAEIYKNNFLMIEPKRRRKTGK